MKLHNLCGRYFKYVIKLLAFIVIVAMTIQLVPIYAIGQNFNNNRETLSPNDDSPIEEELSEEPYVLYEILEKRGEYEKYYTLSDGTVSVAVYGEPVHYLDGAGKWQNIDNTLSVSGNEIVVSGNTNIKFAKKSSDSKLLSLQKENYKVSFSLENANKSKSAMITNPESTENNRVTGIQPLHELQKLVSSVKYNDILDDIDLEYVLYSNSIKENIIVKRQSAQYQYHFILQLSRLVPHVSDDGEIYLCDDINGDIIYVLPASYMYDAVEACSKKVEYSIRKVKNKEYRLTVTADADWINDSERVFPVTIDPPITTYTGSTNTMEAYISSNNPNDTYQVSDELPVSYYSDNSQIYSYWKLLTLPDIPMGSVIKEAKLSMYSCTSLGLRPFYVALHEVTSAWENSNLTWNNVRNNGIGTICEIATDYQTVYSAFRFFNFDITEIVNKWYKNGTNYGICLSGLNNNTGNIGFYSSRRNIDQYSRPLITIQYLSSEGLEDKWSYETIAISPNEMLYINRATGLETVICKDMALEDADGNKYYIERAGSKTKNTYDFAGYYWRYNFQESLQLPTEGSSYYIYTDEDGTCHYINANGTGNLYLDEENIGITLTIGNTNYIIETPNGVIHTFDNSGRLESRSEDGACFVFSYNSYGRIMNIMPQNDPTKQLSFLYHPSGRLLSIMNTSTGEKITYLNNNGRIGSISVQDSQESTAYIRNSYIYDSGNNNLLIGIEDFTVNKKAQIQYSGDSFFLIRAVKAYAGADSSKNIYANCIFDYKTRCTEIYMPGADALFTSVSVTDGSITVNDTQSDDILTVYEFDTYNRLLQVYSQNVSRTEFYGGNSYEYTNDGKIKRVTSIGDGVSSNYISDPMFTILPAKDSDDSGYVFKLDSSQKLFGKYSALIEADHCDGAGKFIIPVSYMPVDTLCVLSCYVKVNELWKGNQVYIRFYNKYSSSVNYRSVSISSSTTQDVNDGWRRIYFPVITDSHLDNYVELVMSDGRYGFAYFDGLQIEAGKTPSAFSCLENGAAILPINDGWITKNAGASSDSGCYHASSTYLYIVGKTDTENYLEQTVPVNAAINDVFAFTGRTRADSGNKTYSTSEYMLNDPVYRIVTTVNLSNGNNLSDKWAQTPQIMDLGSSSDWKLFAHGVYVDRSDDRISDNTIVESITIRLDYSYNINKAYFTDMTFKKSPSAEYSYDENGNITGISIHTMTQCSYYDDNENEIINGGNSSCILTYDDYGNIASEQYSDGSSVHYTYEEHNGEYEYTSIIRNGTDGIQKSKTLYTYANIAYTDSEGISVTKYKLTNMADYDMSNVKTEETIYTYISPESDDYSTVTVKNGNNQLISSDTYTYMPDSKIIVSRDCVNKVTTRVYDNAGTLISSESGSGITTYFDSSQAGNNRVVTIYTDTNNDGEITAGVDPVITKNYNQKEQLVSLVGGSSYNFVYNLLDNLEKVKIGSNDIVVYEYNDYNGKMNRMTYGNGASIRFEYDNNGNVVKLYTKDTQDSAEELSCTWTYGTDGLLYEQQDYKSGYRQVYEYREDGEISRYIRLNTYGAVIFEVEYLYQNNKLYKMRYLMNGSVFNEEAYVYDEEQIITYTNQFGAVSFAYDTVNRLTSRIQSISETVDLTESYTYLTVSGFANQSEYVASLSTADGTIYTYSYDNNYNITQVKENNAVKITYIYDNLNRLVRENNTYANKTYVLTYDLYGNLLTRNTYPYTTGTVGSVEFSCTYTYNNTEWPDLMTSFNGEMITYDEIGNPLQYYNGEHYNFTWKNGRQLASYYGDRIDTGFSYDSEGLLIGVSWSGNTKQLIREGMKILKEIIHIPGHEIRERVYFYDETNAVAGMEYEGQKYYFGKNLQGDIIKIYNNVGQVVVNYFYDAWGNTVNITGSMKDTVGYANPFRYRSYYYEELIGFYYCNSRFYDPILGRFLNADDHNFLGISDTVLGYNLFTYCENNPVNKADYSGYASYFTTVSRIYGDYYSVVTTVRFWWTKLTYKYNIEDGIIRFSMISNNYWSVLWRGEAKKLAGIMYDATKGLNRNYLNGRTKKGVHAELFLHWALYTVNIKRSSTKVADIGGMWGPGYDNNAWVFEGISLIKRVDQINIYDLWKVISYLRNIARYF